MRRHMPPRIIASFIAAAIALIACTDKPTTEPAAVEVAAEQPFADAMPTGGAMLDAGGDFSCGLRSDARVQCWGINNGQQLNVPTLLGTAVQVTTGNFHSCALLANGSPRCWGAVFTDPSLAGYNYGQTGVPTGVTGYQQIVAGGFHTCTLSQFGTVSCWGRDDYGQSTPPAGLSGVTELSADYFHTCALRSGGTVACWGYPDARIAVPPTLTGVEQITTGGEHSCALAANGHVTCWGVNTYGEITVPASLVASQVSAGLTHVCALRTNGSVICWGNDDHGQATVPAGLVGVTQISAGFAHTCALKYDLSVTCWGNAAGTAPPSSLANHPPTVSFPDTTYTQEGLTVTLNSHGADPDPNTTLTYKWTWYQSATDSTTWNGTSSVAFWTDAPYTTKLKVVASDGQLADTAITVLVSRNVAPKFVTIAAPAAPIAAGLPTTVTGFVYDQGQANTLGVGVRWGAGTPLVAAQVTQQTSTYPTPAQNRAYQLVRSDLTPGVYELSLRVSDPYGGSKDSTLSDFLVVYDPSGSYVTGKGAIKSPAGACKLTCAGAEGRASFGFTSKYAPGATIPTGTTQFEFRAGNLDFVSTSYQWLTVAGPRAQFKGDGTINGTGSYGFLLTAVDGDVAGGGGIDKFRIKIWEKSSGLVVYDNQMDAPDGAELTTALASGSVIIKR